MSSSVQLADALLSRLFASHPASGRCACSTGSMSKGYWWGELTADTTLESDYILLQLWLHPPVNGVWNPPTRALDRKGGASPFFDRQLPDGGFNIYHGGPADVSATVKAYFALKAGWARITTISAWRGARSAFWRCGGIQAANSYVKINLSLFNLYPREGTPAIPPEIMLLPATSSTRCPPGRGPSSFRCPSSMR